MVKRTKQVNQMFLPVPSYKPMVFMPNAIPILLRMHMPSFSDLAIVSYLLWRKKYGTYVQKYPIPLAKAAELANERKGKCATCIIGTTCIAGI